MEFELRSSLFHGAARKLLLAAPAPSPVAPTPVLSPELMCRDVKTGAAVSCQNPHTLVIIVAGMACMMFLVAIALVLLCWSVVRQRRMERLRRELPAANPTSSTGDAGAAPTNPAGVPMDSHKFDDAVFVQLPGDEKPQCFALPKPFHADEHHEQDDAKPVDHTAIKIGNKEPSSEILDIPSSDSEADRANPVVEDTCVANSDELVHNPDLAPR